MSVSKSKTLKKILSVTAIVLASIIVLAGGYVAYVFIAFHRIGDQALTASGAGNKPAQAGETYSLVSYNVGFGAYEADYDFFMDGGTQSWATSEADLKENLSNIAALLKSENADVYFIQEVDIGSTRSYQVDERDYFVSALENKSYTFAQNYDSPFLFYPVFQPHGASKSGIMVFSAFDILSAERKELPIEDGLTKLLDLDRCYTKNVVAVGDKSLVLYSFHLSAYTSDGTIATEQLKLLLADMQSEYEKGNYCVAGGDFNKDVLGDSSSYFGKSDIEYTWAQPIPEGTFDGLDITLIAPVDEAAPVPTCRNADAPYHNGQYVVSIDGFMVSANVTAVSSSVIDTGFAYSDHNPVKLTFSLN